MKISDLLSMCFRSLFRRKVRTFLTVIGVVIGTCSIVIMVSIGVGLDRTQAQQMEQWIDLSMIEVYQGGSDKANKNPQNPLNDDAVKYIASIPHVDAVSPVLPLYEQISITDGKYLFQGSVVAMNLSALKSMGYETTDGRMITDADDSYTIMVGEQVCYNFMNRRTGQWIPRYDEEGNEIPSPIDPLKDTFQLKVNRTDDNNEKPAPNIYYDGDVISQRVESSVSESPDTSSGKKSPNSRSRSLKVAGILKENYGKDSNTSDGIYLDLEYAKKLINDYNRINNVKEKDKGYNNVKVKIDNFKNIAEVKSAIEEMGFETYSAEQELEIAKQQSRMVQLILGALGGISMLVAAIGISNTMIMSIYERTREIGIMKVLGCELKNIRMMFLCEAGAIGLMGGIVGLIISYVLSGIANMIAGGVAGEEYTMQISVIPLWLALIGILFSIMVGLIAGFIPANRAVKISALSAMKQD